MDERNTLKLTQHADDTTVFLRHVQLLKNLFNLLAQFENCSGLRINQTKSELLWLGSLRYRKDTLLNVRLSKEHIYAFGVFLLYNEQHAAKKNCFDRLDPLRRILNIWSSRDISLYGKINIVKAIVIIESLNLLSCVVCWIRQTLSLLKSINWFSKIKRSTLIKSKENGGLNMVISHCLIKH